MSLTRRVTLVVLLFLGIFGGTLAAFFYGSLRNSLELELQGRVDVRLRWLEQAVSVGSRLRFEPPPEPLDAADFWSVRGPDGRRLWGVDAPLDDARTVARPLSLKFEPSAPVQETVPLESLLAAVAAAAREHVPGVVLSAAQSSPASIQPLFRLQGRVGVTVYDIDVELHSSGAVRRVDVRVEGGLQARQGALPDVDTGDGPRGEGTSKDGGASEATPSEGADLSGPGRVDGRAGSGGTVPMETVERIELADLPEPVRATLAEALGAAVPEEVKRFSSHRGVLYAVEARGDGRDIDLEVAAGGLLLEKEVEIEAGEGSVHADELPAAVRQTLLRETGGFQGEIATRLRGGRVVYEWASQIHGRDVRLQVFEDGALRSKESEMDPSEVPEAALKAVDRFLGEVRVDRALRRVVGGLVTLHFEAERDGEPMDLEVTEDGGRVARHAVEVFPQYGLPRGGGSFELTATAAASTLEMERKLARLARVLGVGGPLALLAAGAVLVLLIRAQLRPLSRMAAQASRVGPRDLTERIGPVGTSQECVRLRESINAMVERLADGLERERRFAATAAHELRTPMAQLRSTVEVALRRQRDASEYREALAESVEDIERLDKLVSGLLELTRRPESVRGRPVPLAGLLHRVLRSRDDVARPEGLSESSTLCVEGDEELFTAALAGVCDNAARHGGGEDVTVRVETDGTTIRVMIADRGPGVPPGDRERIFEPLTRLDSAPSSKDGPPGFGLGLAVARSTLRAFGGDLVCRERSDGANGCDFVFTFQAVREN